MNTDNSRQRFELEGLEPRILLSADGLNPLSGVPPTAALLLSAEEIQISNPEDSPAQSESGFGYDPASQLDSIFNSVADSQTQSESAVLAPAPETDDPASTSPDALQVTPTVTMDSRVEMQIATDPAPDTASSPIDSSSSPAPDSPATLSLTEQLTDTLHAANGPPATAADQPVSSDSEYVDPDVLANPQQAIIDGLTALGNWANTLDNFGKFASNLPIIERNVGQMLDAGGILLTYLRDPINAYFTSDTTPTTDELLVALQNLDTTVGGLSITVDDGSVTGGLIGGNEFRFNLIFQATKTVTGIPIGLGPNSDDLNLVVPASASATVNANVSFTFDFSFGLRNLSETSPGNGQYDLTLSSAQSFYISVASLTASAAVHVNNANFNMKVGFIDVGVSNGQIDLDGNATVSLTDPDSNGMITRTELTSTPFANLVSVNLTGTASASLPITNSLFSGTQTLTANWADVNQPDTLTSNVGSLLNYDRFENLTPQTLIDGFNALATWLDSTNNPTMLGKPLPFVSDGVKTVLDIKNLITTRFITQTGQWDTAQTLASKLEAVADLSGVNITFAGNELRYTLNLSSTQTKTVQFRSGLPNLPLSVNVPNFNLTVTATGTLVFALDISDFSFYLRDDGPGPEFSLSASVTANSISATGGVGFLSVDMTGSAQLAASITLQITDPSNDHKITLNDFAGGVGTIASFVTFNVGGTANANLQLASPLAGIPAQPLTLDWPNLADLNTFTSNIASLTDFTSWGQITADAFSAGLNQLVGYLATMANDDLGGNNPLKIKLPLIDKSLAELIDIQSFFESALTNATDFANQPDGTTAPPFGNSAQLLNLLKSLPGVGPSNATNQATADDIRYTLHIDKALVRIYPLKLDLGNNANLSLNSTVNITTNLDLNIDITFGVSKADGTFFIVDSGSPVLSGSATVTTDINVAARLGFLDVSVNHGTATLNAGVAVTLVDPALDNPASPGKITGNEIGNAPVADLVSVAFTGAGGTGNPSLSAALPLSATLGTFTRSGTLTVTWANLLSPSTIALDTSPIADMFNFNSISVDDALQGLLNLPSVLDQLLDNTKFAKELPLIGNGLKNLVQIADRVRGWIDQLAPIVNGARSPTFSSAGSLETRLEQILNSAGAPFDITVTVSGSDVQFAVLFKQTIVNQNLNYAINEGVQGLGFQSTGTLKVNGSVEAKVRFGLAFGAGVPLDQRFYIVPGADSSVALKFKIAANVMASGSFGLITINGNGTARVGSGASQANDASLSIALVDPNTTANTANKIVLAEILNSPLAILGSLTPTGSAYINLSISSPNVMPAPNPLPGVTVEWASIGNLTNPTVTTSGDLSAFISAAANFNLSNVLAGIQSVLNMISAWTGLPIMQTKIPLVNRSLADIFDFVSEAVKFFNEVSHTNAATASAFDTAVQAALTAAGLPAGSTFELIPSSDPTYHNPGDLSNPRVLYLFHYRHNFAANTVDFDWGNDLFSLSLSFTPAITFDLQIEFGFSKEKGFYIVDRDTAPAGEVIRSDLRMGIGEVHLGAGLTASNFNAGGQFGPVIYGVAGGNASANFGLTLNLNDPNSSGGIITTSELTGNITTVLQPSVGGTASIVLPMGVRIGSDGPGVKTTFSAYWNANSPTTFHFGSPSGSTDPADGFSGIQFELGEFLRKLIGPFIEKINEFNPLPPEIIRVINTKLPLIDKTPAELLGDLTGQPEIKLLFQILQVVTDLNTVINSGKDLDLSGYIAGESAPSNPGSGSATGGDTSGGSTGFLSALDDFGIRIFGDLPSKLFTSSTPIPGAIIRLLLKDQNVEFVAWKPAQFHVGFEFNSPPIPLFSFGIPFIAEARVEAQIGGSIGFFANLEIGFTSRGLFFDPDGAGPKKPSILNGFYFGDNIVNGEDQFEVGFTAEVHLDISGVAKILGVDAVRVYGRGGVRGTIGLDMADVRYDSMDPTLQIGVIQRRDTPQGDNKVYLDEIGWIVNNYGLTCALSLGGTLEAFLGVGAKALCLFGGCLVDVYDEATVTIANFDIPCMPNTTNLADVSGNSLVMFDDNAPDSIGDHDIVVTVRVDRDGNPLGLRIQKHQKETDVERIISSLNATNDIYGRGVSLGDKALYNGDVYTFFGPFGGWIKGGDAADTITIGDKNEFEEFTAAELAGVDTLVIKGTQGNDKISIDPTVSEVLGIQHITIDSRGGNDQIDFGTLDPATSNLQDTNITTGDGDDRIVGTFARDVIHAGAGNDTVSGEGGNDDLYGEDGDDTLSGGAGDDYIDGGLGADTIYGQGGINTIHGRAGNDTIVGGDDRDVIYGEEDIDNITGQAGNDEAHGGSADDTVFGGTGDDSLFGDAGNDILNGEDGNDFIDGGSGMDEIKGEAGIDTLNGGSEDDTIYGGSEDDTINGNDGNDVLYGGPGNDTISGGNNDDRVYGEDGNDIIHGDDGQDELHGGNGNDSIYGGNQNDTIFGEGNDDYIEGNAGTDTITGGAGDDFLIGGGSTVGSDAGAGDTINGESGNDIIIGDDGAKGSIILLGGTGNDILSGGSGDDQIFGEGGNDTITGDAGNDLIHGNDGNDTINGNDNEDDLYGDAGQDTIHGDNGLDRIWGGDDVDTITGDAGNDVIRGDNGNDIIQGNAGDDVIYGGAGDDNIEGNAGLDRIYGGDGNDTIYGYALVTAGDDNTADTIFGENGNDIIHGNGGDDSLDGGAGVDMIYGEDGNDLVMAGTGVGDQLFGGNNDDHLIGSDEGADTDPNFNDATYFGDVIDGGAGNDWIEGLGGADNLQGGEGDDAIDSGVGADLVHGGNGNDDIFAGHGLGDTIFGDDGDDVIYGAHEGNDAINGGNGNDRIYGQGGTDVLHGNEDDDYVDGGGGTDQVFGDNGNDELVGGGGAGDVLDGGNGDDLIHGSDDGADNITGGAGNDRILGNGGNDTISGGPGDDIIDGGAGDDTISGDEGSDLILGGADHDTLFGQNASGTGEDNAVDYLYGDFGTNANPAETGSGRDRLFGGGGNDLIYGEGEDDFIDGGSGGSNLINYGSGESATPSDYVAPTATPAPAIQPTTGISHAPSTLTNRTNERGRWTEFSSSASDGGLSDTDSLALEPSIATDSLGNRYIAWVDGRNGNYEIYVAVLSSAGVWSQLAGSAQDGGVSNTLTSSRRPSIAVGADNHPVVAWTEFGAGATSSNIRVAKYDPTANGGAGGWVALGSSLTANGVSSSGLADNASLVIAAAGPTVGWLDNSSGTTHVRVRQFSGGNWNELGAGSATGFGISGSAASVRDLVLTTDGATKMAAAWTQPVGGSSQIYVKESTAGGAFTQIGNSATGGGASNTLGASSAPTMAYRSGALFVAWQDETNVFSEIYAVQYSSGTRTVISTSGGGVSNTNGSATQPSLASNGSNLYLAWADDTANSRVGTKIAIYVRKWSGASFVEELTGDAAYYGISYTGGMLRSLDLALDNAGKPFVAWNDQTAGSPQIYVRGNTFTLTNIFTASGATSVQSILDALDLNPGDVILVTSNTGGFTVGGNDAGVLIHILPTPNFSSAVSITVDNVTIQGGNFTSTITATNANGFTLRDAAVSDGVTVSGGSNAQLLHNLLYGATAVTLTGGATSSVIEHNNIHGSTTGLAITAGGATGVVVFDNKLTAANRPGHLGGVQRYD